MKDGEWSSKIAVDREPQIDRKIRSYDSRNRGESKGVRQAEAAHASEVGGRSTSEEVDNISEVRHVNSHVLSMPASMAIADAGKDRDFPRGIASASHQEITVSKHAVCKVLTRVNRCCFQRSDNLEADSLLRKIRSRFALSFFIACTSMTRAVLRVLQFTVYVQHQTICVSSVYAHISRANREYFKCEFQWRLRHYSEFQESLYSASTDALPGII